MKSYMGIFLESIIIVQIGSSQDNTFTRQSIYVLDKYCYWIKAITNN